MRKLLSIIKLSIIESFIYKLVKYRYGLPGLFIHPTATLICDGDFRYKQKASIGRNSFIRISEGGTLSIGESCYLGDSMEIGTAGVLSIGDNTTIQHRSTILGDVSIGRYCIFGPNVYISSGNHNFDLYPAMYISDQDKFVAQKDEFSARRSNAVVVDDDCWIGINVAVMPGVRVGKGAIVGANSVVTKDVAPYSVVAGVPARTIRKRLDFVAPAAIESSNPNDHPYFYSGFFISHSDLIECGQYDGLVAGKDFSLCLDGQGGKILYVRAMKLGSEKASLSHSLFSYELGDEFSDLQFEINQTDSDIFSFEFSSDNESTQLIVQKAWIQ